MILGIGTDIIDTRRIERMISLYGSRFLDRIFTEKEQGTLQLRHSSSLAYSTRFAAKEAFSKAVGTGIGRMVSWKDIEIEKNIHGKPFFVLTEKAQKELFLLYGSFKSFLSLSHDYPYAQAFVILEKDLFPKEKDDSYL